jgi:hypothetical protein
MFHESEDTQDDDDHGGAASRRAGTSLPSGWDMGQPLGFDLSPPAERGEMSFDFEGFDSPSSSLSLDDFEGESNPPAEALHSPEGDASLSGMEDGFETTSYRDTATRKHRRKLLLIGSLLACIGIMAAIAVPVYKAMKPKAPPLVGKKSVRHALAVQEFQEEFEFLVLATSERDKNLINMRLGFVFAASNAFEDFAGRATFYRETVYQYLLRARPAKNSQKLWQGILEKQLTEYMKQNFPKSGLKTIRVSHWERL